MKRDFSNESLINIFFRFYRFFQLRLRGKLLWLCLSKNSSSNITFGKNPKFMNSKWILMKSGVAFGNFARIECYKIGDNIIDAYSTKISIGQNTSFGDFVHIGAINKITIGNNVLCGGKILIIDHDHGKGQNFLESYKNIPPRERELFSKGVINIADNVWIGEGAIILAGSDIGEGAIIGANAIVNGKVEPYKVFISGKK